MATSSTPWSSTELSLLLRAWADMAGRDLKNASHTIFLRYQALWSARSGADYGSTAPMRAEPSVYNMRKVLENMHAIISRFLVSNGASAPGIDDVASSGGRQSATMASLESSHRGDGGGYGQTGGKLHAWLRMSEAERRLWFITLNTNAAYPYTEMTKQQFNMLTRILASSSGGGGGSIHLPRPVYVKPEAQRATVPKTQAEPNIAAITAMVRARIQFRVVMDHFMSEGVSDTTSTKNAQPAASLLPPPLPVPPQRSEPVAEESGNESESDSDWEGIVPQSPICEESGSVTTSNQLASEQPRSSDKTSKTGVESHKRKLQSGLYLPEPATHLDKRSKPAQQDIWKLLDAIERQTRALKKAFRHTRLARRQDQVERQEILGSLRQEQDERLQVLETLRRQGDVVRQQQAYWRREQEGIQREYAELLDGN